MKKKLFRKISGNSASSANLFTVGHILPAFVTLSSCACGMTAILWASRGYFGRAVLLVMLGAILDGLDGRLARMFKTSSQFGVELDSLVDAISFGVAPAFVTFFYATSGAKGIGWVVSVMFACACVLRLARFNTMAGSSKVPEYWSHFFTGMPAPAGGLMAFFPIALYNATKIELFQDPRLVAAWVSIIAFFFVSRIPMLSLKKVKVSSTAASYILIMLVLALMLLVFYFWHVLAVTGALYLLSMPFVIASFLKARRLAEGGAK
ncbi:MAG: CDP-diacylglycerol--serine O-phosphatidyltransferase [Rickettsiales bacterium]|jgi:CDP-diacylglycerol--serine O-phosphatidyltransferase|nr:CDP-diacylglycerol--serine O-phosphatidyltransferase [Rickettsiales bacterium]